MSIKLNLSLILFISISFLFSCDDAFLDTSIPPPPQENPDTISNPSNPFMRADVDGQEWNATAAGALIQFGKIGITGQANDGTLIILSIEGNGLGNYDLTRESISAGIYNLNDATNIFTSNASDENGVVTITEINSQDSTISGTFSFVGARAIPAGEATIEVGEFNRITLTSNSTTTDEFNGLEVKIDGVLFQPTSIEVTTNPFSNALVITATSSSGTPTLTLFLPKNIREETFELGTPGFADYAAQFDSADGKIMGAESGEVMITYHDLGVKAIVGTFAFEAAELSGAAKASLTEGRFQVAY